MTQSKVPFSRSKLTALKLPKSGWVYFHDSATRGLVIGLSATGAKSFRLYRKFKGRPLWVTLGAFDADLPETRDLPDGASPLDLLGNTPRLNVRMARNLATAVNAQLDAGVNPAQVNRRARKGVTLGELFEHYRVALISEGKRSVPMRVWYYERYLGALPDEPRKKHGAQRKKAPGSVNWHRRVLSDITRAGIRLRLNLGEKVGHTTSNRVIELLRAMYNHAKEHAQDTGYTGENPATGKGKFTVASRERFLRADEVPAFFEKLETEADGEFRDYVKMSIYTGARRGNVLRMRWDELSLNGARWAIPAS